MEQRESIVGGSAAADARAYYATPGPLTDLSRYGAHICELPTALGDLCRVGQGLVVHPFLGHLYGLQPNEVRLAELETRTASDMMARILELDSGPLAEARPPQSRFVGNCRHFTVLLCALLRARGLPARARCGFGAYFDRSSFVDHWVCEVWNESRGSWHLTDAQLDAAQRQAFGVQFDPLDVPRSEFVVAGHAWQRCRSGRSDAQSFGILDLRGLWFVRGNVVRDLAAFAKRELLPWDGWGIMATRDDGDAAEMALLDRVAELTLTGDDRHAERLELQRSHPGLRVPPAVLSFNLGGAPVFLGPGIAN